MVDGCRLLVVGQPTTKNHFLCPSLVQQRYKKNNEVLKIKIKNVAHRIRFFDGKCTAVHPGRVLAIQIIGSADQIPGSSEPLEGCFFHPIYPPAYRLFMRLYFKSRAVQAKMLQGAVLVMIYKDTLYQTCSVGLLYRTFQSVCRLQPRKSKNPAPVMEARIWSVMRSKRP
jgi:hypothetical protein